MSRLAQRGELGVVVVLLGAVLAGDDAQCNRIARLACECAPHGSFYGIWAARRKFLPRGHRPSPRHFTEHLAPRQFVAAADNADLEKVQVGVHVHAVAAERGSVKGFDERRGVEHHGVRFP